MPINDLDINAKIRAILARHWIDADKLRFRTTGGTVRFHGTLARQGSLMVCDVEATLIEVLINEIRHVPGVQKVYFTGVDLEQRTRRIDALDGAEIYQRPESPEAARTRAIRELA